MMGELIVTDDWRKVKVPPKVTRHVFRCTKSTGDSTAVGKIMLSKGPLADKVNPYWEDLGVVVIDVKALLNEVTE